MRKIFSNPFIQITNKFLVYFFLSSILFIAQIKAQSISVSGKITSSRYPVSDASVTFIDNADTTIQYSTLTDSHGNYATNLIITSVNSEKSNVPIKFQLGQSYPNPFSSKTAIPYGLNKESKVQLVIYDILGRVIRKFDFGKESIGTHHLLWDGTNNSGRKVANGIYFYKIIVDGESQVKKMIFNQNGSSSFAISNSFSFPTNESLSKVGKSNNSLGTNFSIRLKNTENTNPIIEENLIENVEIKNDTTINFSVNYLLTAEINLDSVHQIIRGFGAANIVGWRSDMTDSEIQTAFGTGDGQLGFTILRLRIPPDSTQWSANLSTAKKAHDMDVLIFASPWNPPSSMTEIVDGQKRLRYDKYNEYAEYLNSFNSFMNNNGVPLYAISVQNEPDYASDWTGWTSDEMLKFIKENAQVIGNRVIAPESYQFRRNMSDPILNDPIASANLDIVGGHIYGNGLSEYPLAEQKGKEVWMTEHYTDSEHSANLWPLALDVGKEIQQVMEANMNAYVWWYIVRYYGPIGDGETSNYFPREYTAKKGEVTKRGYVMSQFARFIRPGFYRVESSVTPPISSAKVTAYKNIESSKVVIVAINPETLQTELNFRIHGGAIPVTFQSYTTSATKNCKQGIDVTATDGNLTVTLDASSITTIISN